MIYVWQLIEGVMEYVLNLKASQQGRYSHYMCQNIMEHTKNVTGWIIWMLWKKAGKTTIFFFYVSLGGTGSWGPNQDPPINTKYICIYIYTQA